jgi:hypothetical protein
MATWQVALVREQGVEFGVVSVQDHVINDSRAREELLRAWTIKLQRPVALLGARQHRTYGRQDIVNWLGSIDPARLPWRPMTIAA